MNINFVSEAWDSGKKLYLLFLASFFILLASCEDPGILNGDKNFTRSSLQTIYVDTFLISTSTIRIDSLPTSGNNRLIVGNYKDSFLGNVSASTYFQIGYNSSFAPDQSTSFDSIGLILPYSKYFYGDTTKSQIISIYQLTAIPKVRISLPYRSEDNVSFFVAASQGALYNTSNVSYNSIPITTANIRFYPHRDSLYLKLPLSFGKNWFDIAKAETLSSTSSYFKNVNLFVTDFFNGIHIASDASSNSSIVSFLGSKAKVRIYYKQLFGDIIQQTHFDFPMGNSSIQFNKIVGDRSGTLLSSLAGGKAIPSSLTGNSTYVQSGVGLATKVEFPTLKRFFSTMNFVLIDAALEVVPVQNTYPIVNLLPRTLSLYVTDQSNIILNKAPALDRSGYLSANINYDFEFGRNTKYSFPLINYLSAELKSTSNLITPLVIASPTPAILTEVNRIVIGDQSNTQYKIKLKIYYSYVPNQ